MKRSSRRKFLQVMAAGSAALAAGAVAPLARPARAARPARKRTAVARPRAAQSAASTLSPAMLKEIASQKKSLAGTLETLRRHPLPPGSPPAFVFRPLRPARGRSRP